MRDPRSQNDVQVDFGECSPESRSRRAVTMQQRLVTEAHTSEQGPALGGNSRLPLRFRRVIPLPWGPAQHAHSAGRRQL